MCREGFQRFYVLAHLILKPPQVVGAFTHPIFQMMKAGHTEKGSDLTKVTQLVISSAGI